MWFRLRILAFFAPRPIPDCRRRRRTQRQGQIVQRIVRYVLFISVVAITVIGVVKFYRFQVHRHAEAFLRSGISAVHRHRWADAVQQFTAATALAPDQLQAYVLLAGVLRQTGSLTGADECIERMLVANPDSAAAKVRGGRYFLDTGRAAAAAPQVAAALALAVPSFDVQEVNRSTPVSPPDISASVTPVVSWIGIRPPVGIQPEEDCELSTVPLLPLYVQA